MTPKKSFIVRLFCVLFALLFFILAAAGASIYFFSQQEVGQEFIRLNQASLRQLAAATGRALGDIRAFGEQASVNNRLIELASAPGTPGDKEARSLLSSLIVEYAYRKDYNPLMDISVAGNNGLSASVYGAMNTENLRNDPRFAPLLAGEEKTAITPTQYHADGKGVMVYTFQMAFAIQGLLAGAGEPHGVVVLDLSELVLYNQYKDFQQGGAELAVIDGAGTVMSSRDKQRIGGFYGHTQAQLETITSQTSTLKRIVGGHFYLYERIPGTEWFLVEQVPTSTAFGALQRVGYAIVAILLIFGVAMAIALITAARRALAPVMGIKNAMGQVMEGDLSVRIESSRKDEFGHIEQSFNAMVAQISLLIEEVVKEERQKRLAELDFLQAQINPHFIHNTLTSIRFLLEMGKTEDAGEMVFYFSKLLRQTLSRSDEFITLRGELDTLDSYIRLQKIRYKDSFEVEYHIDETVLDQMVPALLLQPVVENAIFHGVGHDKVTIRISAACQEGGLVVTVADDGVGMPTALRDTVLQKDVQINRVGLRNVHDRIRLNYGIEYGLSVSETPGGGATIIFSLPMDEGARKEGPA